MEQDKQNQIKVGVMILKDGKVLLGKRHDSHGHGEFAFLNRHHFLNY